jgi:hypothetical protein
MFAHRGGRIDLTIRLLIMKRLGDHRSAQRIEPFAVGSSGLRACGSDRAQGPREGWAQVAATLDG